MTSQRRLEANRRNALKSTGPKTPEGKAAVRLNALKHGLLSRDILLPGEDEAALGELRERLRGRPGKLRPNKCTAWRSRRSVTLTKRTAPARGAGSPGGAVR